MENFDEKINSEVTKASRNKLICTKCEVFPRPGVKLMRCVSCQLLLCQNCCEDNECPLCQYKSKDVWISTFIQQSELMDFLSGFKTHPCINFKNGCRQEIPAKLDDLKVHDQRCIFQMVPCPQVDCKETVIFKNLDDHLKKAHINNVISIFCGAEKNEYTHEPRIYGIYKRQAELVNDRNYFEKDNYGIWFSGLWWWIGLSNWKGDFEGFARVQKNIPNLDETTNWSWRFNDWLFGATTWYRANKNLGVKGMSTLHSMSEVWKIL